MKDEYLYRINTKDENRIKIPKRIDFDNEGILTTYQKEKLKEENERKTKEQIALLEANKQAQNSTKKIPWYIYAIGAGILLIGGILIFGNNKRK